jgi:integrase
VAVKEKITKRMLDGLKAPEGRQLRVYDTILSGFGVLVGQTKRSFFVEYGPRDGRQRMTIGVYGALTVDAARTLAQVKLGEVAAGENPMDEREARRAMPTFGEWRDRYLERVRRTKKQPRHDERYLGAPLPERDDKRGANRIREEDRVRATAAAWAKRPLDRITPAEVSAAMGSIAEHGHTTANRWLASVRACFQEAVDTKVIADNPASAIKAFRENPPRARVLSPAEFDRVVAAFEALPDPFTKAAFVVLLDTGTRKSEVLHARWDDFDLDGGTWRIPSPKAGHPQVVPLAEGTVAYLRAMERLGPWFVPGRDPSRHRENLRSTWDRLRAECGVADVTIHDLRRTFGLHIARKAGLHVASKLLRHSDVRVTERVYAPLGLDDLRAAANNRSGVTTGRDED